MLGNELMIMLQITVEQEVEGRKTCRPTIPTNQTNKQLNMNTRRIFLIIQIGDALS